MEEWKVIQKSNKTIKRQGVFFMYKDQQLEQAERYERKMQLVQAVRAENQANRQRLQHRNRIFYHTTEESLPTDFQDAETNFEQNRYASKNYSFLGLRIGISILCILACSALKYGKIHDFAGINAKEIKAYVAQDFSKVVVDYMKNITYTLNYEKTSIK